MTVRQLFDTMERGGVCIFDSTGNINLGTYYKGDNKKPLPAYFDFIPVERMHPVHDEIFINVSNSIGDLSTRSDDVRARAIGFDFEKGGDFFDPYAPSFIILKVTHFARCEESVKRLKLTPDTFGGYSFKKKKKKYTLRNFLR